MEITTYSVVGMKYKLTISSGEVVDQTTEEEPFSFIVGLSQVLPQFEENMKGKKAGDNFSFDLSVEDAYGEYSPELVTSVPKEIFSEAPEEYMEVGNSLPMQDQMGNPIFGVIVEIGEEKVKMDFNHPLAGEGLHFDVEVLSVRPAKATELDLGSVEDN